MTTSITTTVRPVIVNLGPVNAENLVYGQWVLLDTQRVYKLSDSYYVDGPNGPRGKAWMKLTFTLYEQTEGGAVPKDTQTVKVPRDHLFTAFNVIVQVV